MEPDLLKKTKHGLLINEGDIEILKRYGIDVDKCTKISEVLYQIENTINDLDSEEADELDYIAETLQERMYYNDYRK